MGNWLQFWLIEDRLPSSGSSTPMLLDGGLDLLSLLAPPRPRPRWFDPAAWGSAHAALNMGLRGHFQRPRTLSLGR